MELPPKFERTYTNPHGESWRFFFDPQIGRAAITGDDVDWAIFPVYGGTAKGLVLAPDESAWLNEAWTELESKNTILGLYLGNNTQFVIQTNFCRLSEDFCPICLKQKQQFDIHHCIASSDGGPNDYRNLLRICRSCHVVLSAGSIENKFPKAQAAFWHQIAYFGFDFFPSLNSRGGRHPDVSFHTHSPKISELLGHYQSCKAEEQHHINQSLMEYGRLEYQYFRDLGLEKWSWAEFRRLFCRPEIAEQSRHPDKT